MKAAIVQTEKAGLVFAPGVQELASRFIDSLDVGTVSRNVYRRALRQFLLWLERERITKPTRESVLTFKRYLEREKSAFTVNAYLSVVRTFFAWLQSQGLYLDVAQGIRNVKKPSGSVRDSLGLGEIKILLDTIERGTLTGKRDFALLNLMIHTGLRTIEIARADVGDIRQSDGQTILWIQGKGHAAKDSPVVLYPEAATPIFEYLGLRGSLEADSPLFASVSNRQNGGRLSTRSISRIVKQRLHAVNMISPRLCAHALRHTALNIFIDKSGGDILGAATLARHENITTTQIYIKRKSRIANAPEKTIVGAFRAAGIYST